MTLSTPNTDTTQNTPTDEENLTYVDEGNTQRGITGFAVADFVKTKTGKGVIVLIVVLILVGIYLGFMKKPKTAEPQKNKNSKDKSIKVVKLSDLKKSKK